MKSLVHNVKEVGPHLEDSTVGWVGGGLWKGAEGDPEGCGNKDEAVGEPHQNLVLLQRF